MNLKTSSVKPTDGALICKYPDGVIRKYTFQPVRGTHTSCYQELHNRKIPPAEGFDLALIVASSFTPNQDWQRVRRESLVLSKGGIRMPLVFLISNIEGKQGILIARDYKGQGQGMELILPDSPNAPSGWIDERGVCRNENSGQVWVPGVYFSQEIKADDKPARGVFDDEGAEIFVKTAVDNKLIPYRWMPSVANGSTVKRVGLLHGGSARLNIDLDYNRDDPDGSAFGCVKIDA